MAIMQFVELWALLPKAPTLSAEIAEDWFSQLRRITLPFVKAEFAAEV